MFGYSGLFECMAERPSTGEREIQLWLNYDLSIYTGDSDHPCILSYCISTRACLMEVLINWTLEANQKDEFPCSYLNKQYQAEEWIGKKTSSYVYIFLPGL